MGEGRRARSRVGLTFCLAVALLVGCRNQPDRGAAATDSIKVLRVQSPSDDRSGAEHCNERGAECRPLAPGQAIPRSGIVRTFAGSAVSLDLGHGRRLDLGPLSETKLSTHAAELTRGDVGVTGSPLIQKESAFDFVVGRRSFQLDGASGALAALSVAGNTTELTLRRGKLRGTDLDGLSSGQTVRLTESGAFHTSAAGGELAPLPYVGTRRRDFGELWPGIASKESRGLGTMSARVPNTEQVLSGVRLLGHRVEVTIVDGLARTEVVEEFENQTEQILEGRFRFPVPGDAAVSRLGLWVGDELVEGEVVEAKRARSIYESIVDRPVPRDPALLEWVTAGEMSLKVFPILPKKTRRVLLGYDQLLTSEGGHLRYSYPLSLGEGRENAIRELSIAVHVLDTEDQIESIRVPSHDARIGREGAWRSAYFAARDVTAGQDFVLLAERRRPTFAQVALDMPGWTEPPPPPLLAAAPRASQPVQAAGSGHFALRASVDLARGVERPKPVRADRALVLDVSYSQSAETIRAQAALALAIISELEPEEGVVILACDSACAVHASPPGPLEPRLDLVRRFLGGLAPGGASDLAGALVAGTVELGRLGALSGGKVRQLVLLSDGQASAGELSPQAIARVVSRHLAPLSIDLRLVGVGRKIDSDQLTNLALELDAAVDYLPTAVDLEQRLFEIAIGLRQPVVRSLEVALPSGFVPTRGSRLPAQRLGQELIITGDVRELSGGSLELSGRLDGRDYRLVAELDVSKGGRAKNPFVAALCAREQIRRLLSEPESREQKAEIVRLSVTYRAMSPYTSFLVLENDDMFQTFGIQRSQRDNEPSRFSAFDMPAEQPMSLLDEGPAKGDERKLEQAELEKAVATPSASAAAPSPPPAPKAKKALGSGGAAEANRSRDSDPMGGLSADYGDPLSDGWPGAYARSGRPWVRPTPRAHLAYSAADDAWRSWAAVELENLRVLLERSPESRSRLEEFVRRHLAQGRFVEAAQVARRFLELDPDYLVAQDLLAQAAVVSGDHELARRMLDVQVETNPKSVALHGQAARAFDNAGDGVRACAHRRTLAELAPGDAESQERARDCWNALLGASSPLTARANTAPAKPAKAEVPQLRVVVTCDSGAPAADCPAPVIVGPDGHVTSPWTPGIADSTVSSVALQKLRTGSYFVLLLGGAPGVRGRVKLEGRHETTTFAFVAGGLRTLARAEVVFY